MLRRILILFVLAALYVWFFGFQTAVVVEQHYFAWKSPSMWAVPVQLPDTSVSESAGRKLSYLGCEFEVPWSDLDEQKTRLLRNWQVIAFHSGKEIVLMRFAANERVSAAPFLFQKLDSETLRKLRLLYGQEALRSDYGFTRAVLETTPGSTSIFSSRKEAVRSMLLLLFKPVLSRDAESGIYLIRTKNFEGFQYGNPQARPPEIVDELFSEGTRLEFDFHCKGARSTGCVSQAEINRVIQSAQMVR
jgi:hypothetical protein